MKIPRTVGLELDLRYTIIQGLNHRESKVVDLRVGFVNKETLRSRSGKIM